MFAKSVAVLALAASGLVLGVRPSLAGTGSSPAATAPTGWYDTYGNAADAQVNPAEKILSPSAVKNIEYLRSITAPQTPPGAACGAGYVASPLPYGGSLYAVTSGAVGKYNPATGSLIWRAKLNPNYFYASIAVSGNLVIVAGVGCESISEPGGLVYALNAATGARVWTYNDEDAIFNMVKAGSYVLNVGDDGAGYEVSALNVSTGNPAWSDVQNCGFGFPSALVVGLLAMTYGCDANGEDIQAQNLATGTVAWSLPGAWTLQRGDLSGSAGQHLFATDPSGTVDALNPQTGQTEYSLSQAVNVLAVDASSVYASCGSGGKSVCAYALSTGALQWQRNDLVPLSTDQTAAEADGVLYLPTGQVLNAATGRRIKVLQSPTAIAVGDGRIAIVNAADGRVLDLYGLAGS